MHRSSIIQIGVIGCGVISAQHIKQSLKLSKAKVAMVADIREEAARAMAERFKIPRWTTKPSELIADPAIDAVVLALPASIRTPLALEAFKHGKHVLIEKPVAMNAGEVRKLIHARGRLVAACCSCRHRGIESSKIATKLIASGVLGRIRELRSRALFPACKRSANPPPDWRLKKSANGGGILMNWGCYDMDLLFGVLGWKLKPISVFASTWPIAPHLAKGRVAPGSDAETHVSALIKFKDGIAMNYERGEFTSSTVEGGWQIIGEKGSLQLCLGMDGPLQIVLNKADARNGVTSKVMWKGTCDWDRLHLEPIEDFTEAIRLKRKPWTTLENALVVQKISDAIYRSAASGKLENV